MLLSTTLPDRALITVTGKDAQSFLQGLVTADMRRVTEDKATLAALLSPQGKFLADFFILKQGDHYYLDTETATLENLMRRLTMYKLRSEVEILHLEGWEALSLRGDTVWEATGLPAQPGACRFYHDQQLFVYVDARSEKMGVRLAGLAAGIAHYLTAHQVELSPHEEYEYHRLSLGVPEGSKDAVIDRTVLLENGYDRMHGVDFTKGCYVGQEVTARSHHLGKLRKALFQVRADGPLPPPGTDIHAGEKGLGQLRSTCRDVGLALIRTEEWEQAEKEGIIPAAGGVSLQVVRPFWHAA